MALPPLIAVFSQCYTAPKAQEEREKEHEAYQTYNCITSTLPRHQGWGGLPIRKYQEFWIPELVLPNMMAFCDRFHPRSGDVMLVSHPKCGSTWLKALAFAVIHRTTYTPSSPQHPLLNLTIHDCVPFVEELYVNGLVPDLDVLPSPRLISTHTPYSLLPDRVKHGQESKIVYIAREPKDALISIWHFSDSIKVEAGAEPLGLDEAAKIFCEGNVLFGPIWEHQLEYWQESQRQPQKVLFLKYEDIKSDGVKEMKRLAEFMGCPFTEEEAKEGVVEEIVNLCSFDRLRNLAINPDGVRMSKEDEYLVKNSSYFRKGEVGDWKEHMTPDMANKVDEISREKFNGSGLCF